MHELNIMRVAVSGNIKWQYTEEVWLTQLGYCLIISYCQTAKMPSNLFDSAIHRMV